MDAIDKAHWARLSPLLDELLDLDEDARAARLAALRAADATLADELHTLLARLPGLEQQAFLDAPALPPDTSLAGQTVGPYTVERQLGEGGMGSVWLARRNDGRFQGSAAIKFLHGGLMARGDAERFEREGSILARLDHANIARLIDAGVMPATRQPFLVLEYIEGETIDRYCDSHALDIEARVTLFLDVLAAVTHAHNRLILHRDLKPSNILVTAAGVVKLLDFGIATLLDDRTRSASESELTQRAGRAFTTQYAAPEQLQGGEVTAATDVYALGVLLYQLLTGVHPTAALTASTGHGTLEQMRAVVEHVPRRLSETVLKQGGPAAARRARSLRGDLDTIVARALKKAPDKRYANAAELSDDLGRYLHDEPIAARPDAAGYRVAKFVRRHRVGVAAGSIAALALMVGAAVALWEANEARQQRVQAEGLIEFMLTDLRKKLQPVGRLEALDAVGERALNYYAAQDADRLDADSLGRRARALHLIGEIAQQRGSLSDASKMFEQAAESTGELLLRHPADGQRIYDHAQSVYWVGYVARRRGDAGEAAASFEQYLELAQRLATVAPDNVDWRAESAHAGVNLGVVRLEAAEPARALEALDGAAQVWRELVRLRPEFNNDLGHTLGWIAKAREARGDYAAAIEAQQQKIVVALKMPDAARDQEIQRLLANANYELGRLQLAQGQYTAAVAAERQALQGFDALLAVDDSNVEWLAQSTFAIISLAEAQFALGDHTAAQASTARAAGNVTRLLAVDAKRVKWSVTLAGGLLLLKATQAGAGSDGAGSNRTGGNAAMALRHELDGYLAGVQDAETTGKPLDPEQVRIVASATMAQGDLLAGSGVPGAARAAWQSAATRLQKSAGSGDLPSMTLLAQAQWRLGDIPAAQALADKVGASPYRHPAYADLRQRLGR